MKTYLIALLVITLGLQISPALGSPDPVVHLFNDIDIEGVWSEVYPHTSVSQSVIHHDLDKDGEISVGDLFEFTVTHTLYEITWTGDVYYLTNCTPTGYDLYIYEGPSLGDIGKDNSYPREWIEFAPHPGNTYHTTELLGTGITFEEGFECDITLVRPGVILHLYPDSTKSKSSSFETIKALF